MDLQAWVTKGKEKILSLGLKQWGMLLVAGLCCLIIVFPMGNKEETKGTEEKISGTGSRPVEERTEENENYVELLENRLSELLSSVEAVGRVKVMITVDSTTTKHVLQDGSREREQVTEQDNAGGSRTSVSERSEGTTVFYEVKGENIPYLVSESYPEVTGVVVIAEGSGTGTVDFDILNAVQVLFNVPAHKIKIMKMK